ncbi:hypothetical protein E1B28_003626 [Marasmius oreades]|uniref:Uncharacterized protein n=1 Tax=Marasmius oreades TaxID=181124 RepID=A0A9P7RMD0_9AGAR|nr:uncharacterized protein E1B28_003626 [Marasmius oreades]KAG7086112.1 hypothetical protein E1B28_003626 [Marasmius oreades]
MSKIYSLIALLPFIQFGLVNAHVAAWAKGMYCLNGTRPGIDDQDNSAPVQPLFELSKNDWWMQGITKCMDFPPPQGTFLTLPANRDFKVELATNRGFTTLGWGGTRLTKFAGPINVPEDQFGKSGKCITDPNIHTINEETAAGTVFAIAYKSDPRAVQPEDLTVFTVKYHTVWYREVTYDVPDLPECPPDGCVCAWGWVPTDTCGEPNMYMQPFKCTVTGSSPNARPVAPAKPPVYCEGNPSGCTAGAKQMVFYNQLEGNNVQYDSAKGNPYYNERMGFKEGRQADIFT